jgi:hypothetical protein
MGHPDAAEQQVFPFAPSALRGALAREVPTRTAPAACRGRAVEERSRERPGAGPDTRTTQVFIKLADNVRLDEMGFAPFGRVTGGMDAVERLHAGYGDGPPRGQGPEQERILEEGEIYLEREFPRLDRVRRARAIAP